jgi:hypothetical protein
MSQIHIMIAIMSFIRNPIPFPKLNDFEME